MVSQERYLDKPPKEVISDTLQYVWIKTDTNSPLKYIRNILAFTTDCIYCIVMYWFMVRDISWIIRSYRHHLNEFYPLFLIFQVSEI